MSKVLANVVGAVAEKVARMNAVVGKPWTGCLPTPKELRK